MKLIRQLIRLITENKIDFAEYMQNLINVVIRDLKEVCETQTSDDNEFVSFSACELIESLKSLVVKRVERKNDVFLIYVDIKYESYTYKDDEFFIYELQGEIKKILGKNKIIVEGYDNVFPEHMKQW